MEAKSLILIALMIMSVGMFGQQKQNVQASNSSQQQIEQLQEQVIKLQENLSEMQIQLEEVQRVNSNQQKEIGSNNAEFYEHRAQCYEALASKETDPAMKNEYLALAEADRKKAEELKNNK